MTNLERESGSGNSQGYSTGARRRAQYRPRDAKPLDEKKAAMAAFHFRFCKDPDVVGTINNSPQKNQRD
jgi:hypothetical protein